MRRKFIAAAVAVAFLLIRAPAGQKNGCSMDPNGQVTCDPGGGTNRATEPSPTGSGAD